MFRVGENLGQSKRAGIFTPGSSKPMIPSFTIGILNSLNMMGESFVASSHPRGNLLMEALLNLSQLLVWRESLI